MRVIRFLVMAISVFAMAKIASAQAPAQTPSVLSDVANRDAMRGIWASPQQGYVLDLSARNPRVFQIAANACWLDKDLADAAKESLVVGWFNAEKTKIKVATHLGGSKTELTKLSSLPAACDAPVNRSPTAVYEALWQSFFEHYAFFKERNIDWAALREAQIARISAKTTDAGLYKEIAALLSHIDDAHVTLQAKVDGDERRLITGRGATLLALRNAFEQQNKIKSAAEFYKTWITKTQQNIGDALLKGNGKSALSGAAFWGVNDGIGYLSLTNLINFTRSQKIDDDILAVNELLDTFFAACKDCVAVVVDLSQNRGGDDRIALSIAARFSAQPIAVFNKQAYSKTALADVQTFSLEPNNASRWTKPVALITDSVTVSAAEVLTLSMRALPNVTHMGATTRGAMSDALEKSLPNGWRFTLSNEIYRAPNGEVYEARGIAPAVALPIFDPTDLFESHAKAMLKAVQMLRAVTGKS